MEQKVIRELSNEDLKDRLDEERKRMTRMRLNHAVSPLENPHQLKDYKRTIARVLTEMRRRELENDNSRQEAGEQINNK
ncbi:MAG: 50S ribosomal protein L29 [Bacteroidales bacterium]|nr:50S ribosomal protein L29 [Bacteroidales bacterium]